MEKENLFNELKTFFGQKASSYGIALAFVYGSWARGIPREDSDIDLAVVIPNRTEDDLFKIVNQLGLDLEERVRKEMNIIPILNDFRKPMLYYNAIVLGKLVYAESTDQYARFFTEALYQMEDFSLFGIKWQLGAAAKNLAGARKHA